MKLHQGFEMYALISDLTDAAFRLYCYFYATTENGEIRCRDTASVLGYGKDKFDRAIKCLIEHGYLERSRTRNENGGFGKSIYNFCPNGSFKKL